MISDTLRRIGESGCHSYGVPSYRGVCKCWLDFLMGDRSRRLPSFVAKENFYKISRDSYIQFPAEEGR